MCQWFTLQPVSCVGSEGGEDALQLSDGGWLMPDSSSLTSGLITATPPGAPRSGLLTELQLLDISHQLVKTLLRVSGKLLEGVQYRPVSRAAADVAVQDVVNLQLGGLRVFLEVTVELHHHARGAVATLSAPRGCQSLLYWMIALALISQPLHRGHLPPSADVEGGQAGVDRPGRPSLRLPHGDDAGPAAALGTGNLRPRQQRHLPDVLGQAQ